MTECLLAYPWPGNVRELENMMERAIVLSGGKKISIAHLSSDILGAYQHKQAVAEPSSALSSLAEVPNMAGLTEQVEYLEKQLIEDALIKTNDNKAKAAQLLDISERSLWYKIKKYF